MKEEIIKTLKIKDKRGERKDERGKMKDER